MTETFGRTVEIAATLAASDSLVITLAAALPARLDRVNVNHNTAIQQFGRIAERTGLAWASTILVLRRSTVANFEVGTLSR